jgi:hypothetical protein
MTADPLTPDALDRLDEMLKGRHLSTNVLIPKAQLRALLAVARDHAHLTAENKKLFAVIDDYGRVSYPRGGPR